MSKAISFGELEFKIVASMDESRGVPQPETPFRILMVGDFSGRESRRTFENADDISDLRAIEVDRDNLKDVMVRLKPELRLPFTGSETDAMTIRFRGLDDFHPDRLYERHDIFESIREIRRKLDDPRTFGEAATEIRSWTESEPAETPEALDKPPIPAPDDGDSGTAGLLDQIIDGAESRPSAARSSADTSDWSRFLREIVRPHLVPDQDPRQIELEDTVDAAAGEMMRIILHHPYFQTFEAAWRGLDFLVSRLETDARLKIYLLDLTKAELAADLNRVNDLRNTLMFKFLVDKAVGTAGSEPWAVIGALYTFGQSRKDAEMLGRIAKISAAAGAPFIAAADPNLLGCDSLAETPDPDDWRSSGEESGTATWQALQKMPESAYLGLVLPRFLLRLPYGSETEPLEAFEFEEIGGDPRHQDYLWGNPCLACICLLGRRFNAEGWNLQPGPGGDLDNLPLHVYRHEDETRIKPCAEALLTERTAEIILNAGLMPLLSFREQDRIRLARFQSLALPPARLAGRWD